MKLKNIALGIGFLVAMFSCSMEDDIAPNMGGEVEGVSEDVYAALQFNISTGTDLNTKATTGVTEPTEDSNYSEMENSEMAVKECFVFVSNGDQIIGRRHYTETDITVNNDSKYKYTLDKHILIKVPSVKPDLTVYVVGMAKDNGDYFATNIYGRVSTLGELKKQPVGKFIQAGEEVGNSLTDFIKVGEGTIDAADYGTSSKTTDFECERDGGVKCGVADVTLTLRTAAIQIASFIIKDSKGVTLFNSSDKKNSAADVRAVITDIQLGTNQQISTNDNHGQLLSTLLNGGEATTKYYAYSSYLNKWESMSEGDQLNSNPINYRFYTYEKQSSPTNVTIKYAWDGREGSTTFSIKTGGTTDNDAKVLANHLYKVNVTITNQVADVDVVTYTMDWVSHDISGDLTK